MKNIKHHPDTSTLMSYAAGGLTEPLGAVVAAHLDLCRHCMDELHIMELIGSTLLERIDPTPVSEHAKTDCSSHHHRRAGTAHPEHPSSKQHSVLHKIIGGRLDDIQWKRLGYGLWHHPIALSPNCKGDLRLLKVAPGLAMPAHSHGGAELTQIIHGRYTDEFGSYSPGDLSDLGDDVEHRPVSDPIEGCICLIASDRRARFKDLLPRLLQPLTGF
ncbi:MAG: ChrR family anti-sigma-E factor [Alphaproteobacteria bacterium]|nr:ChrR family anti-sigma-E factor [Alphaproteobacteria bacterium]